MKQEKNERVMVTVRIRPFTLEEKAIDNTTPIEQIDLKSNMLTLKKDFDIKSFNYDKIFQMNSPQNEIFNSSSKSVIDAVLKGYNGTIFAYGQTGSGKTYTMTGDYESSLNKGIIPRAFEYIFSNLPNDKGYKQYVYVSFIQIYLETIQDLLNPANKDIRIREDPEEGVFLEGVEWFKVNSPEDCRSVYYFGEKNRVTESTKMNAHSSRSHAIFVIRLEKTTMLSKEKQNQISQESSHQILSERVITRSHLYLVDLAGSERVSKSKAVDIRLEETKKINYSLLVLGNCISSLIDPKSTHVSYRDSKLTRLLQESLGGNAKTSMIVTISPSSYNKEETFSSLNFASRAMKVQNKPMIHKIVDYQALSIKLQEDLDRITDQYTNLKITYDQIYIENTKIKTGEEYVEMQLKSMRNLFDDKDSNNPNTPISIEAYENELEKLKSYYENILKNCKKENQKILMDIDRLLCDKESEIEELKGINDNMKIDFELFKGKMDEIQKENDDLKISVSYLTTKIASDENQLTTKGSMSDRPSSALNSNSKDNTELIKTIEELEDKLYTIEEKKENTEKVNKTIIDDYLKPIENELNALILSKTELKQKHQSTILQLSKNELQIRINNDELESFEDINEDKKKALKKDIDLKMQENIILQKNKNHYLNQIAVIEKEIEIKEDIKQQLNNKEIIEKKDKTELACKLIMNEYNNKIKQNQLEIDYANECNEKKRFMQKTTELLQAKEKIELELNEIKKLKQYSHLNMIKPIDLMLSSHPHVITLDISKTEMSLINQSNPHVISLGISKEEMSLMNHNKKVMPKIINLQENITLIGNNNKITLLQGQMQSKEYEIEKYKTKYFETKSEKNNLLTQIESQTQIANSLNTINHYFNKQLYSLSKFTSEIEKINTEITNNPTANNIDISGLSFLLENGAISDIEEYDDNSINSEISQKSKNNIPSSQCIEQINKTSKVSYDNYTNLINAYYTCLIKTKEALTLLDEIKKTQVQNIQKINSMLSTCNDQSLVQYFQKRMKTMAIKAPIQEIILTSNAIYNDLLLNLLTSVNKKNKDNQQLTDKVDTYAKEIEKSTELSRESSNSIDKIKLMQYESQIENMTLMHEAEIIAQQNKIIEYENEVSDMRNDLNVKSSNIELSTKINFVLIYIAVLIILSVIIY